MAPLSGINVGIGLLFFFLFHYTFKSDLISAKSLTLLMPCKNVWLWVAMLPQQKTLLSIWREKKRESAEGRVLSF